MDEKGMDQVEDAIVVSDDTINSVIEGSRSTASVLNLRAKVNKIKQEILKPKIHYDTLPGTQKPTLLQEGADSLGLAFKIAFTFDNQMEGDGIDEIAVRSRCTATYEGIVLGDCEGYASSNEEKYKWRYAVHENEFENTDPDRRRLKWKRDGTSIKQVRTEPADIVNTILKMSQKRAKLGVIKTVLAIGEMFSVDIDDIPPEIRQSLTESEGPTEPKRKSETKKKAPAKKKAAKPKAAPVSTKEDPDEAAEELDEAVDDAYTGTVGSVEVIREGENDRGPWKLWGVTINGFKMTTFDASLANRATSAKGFNKTVEFDYDPPEKEGRDPKLTALRELD